MTVTDTATAVDWVLTWRGRTWTSVDITGHHAAAAAELLGIAPPWEWFDLSDMSPIDGPLQAMSLIAACICVDDEVQGAAARQAVLAALADVTLDELADAISLP